MIVLAVIGAFTVAYLLAQFVRVIATNTQSDSERLWQVQLLAAFHGLTVECARYDEGWVATVNGVDGGPSRDGGCDSFRRALDKLAAAKRDRPLPSYKDRASK